MPANRQKVQLRPAKPGQSSSPRQASGQMQKHRQQQAQNQTQPTTSSTNYITLQQSLTMTRALIETTVATIMYLRDLMPTGSFEDVNLSDAFSSPSSASDPVQSDTQLPEPQDVPGGSQSQQLLIKRLKPNTSEEGDTLIRYIDGMMHAIQRRYLSGMKLIVFLDPEDPDNIIEAYNLNFHYADADSPPTLSVEQAVQRLSVSAVSKKSRSVELGAASTEAQAIRQIKYMLRAAIEATQTLPALPHTRYVNIKLYYTDDAPASYEPPHFRVDSQDLVMGTHGVSEAPLEFTAGSMQTGHHGVTLRLSSIVEHLQDQQDTLLPDDLENLMDLHVAQLEDSKTRIVLWDAENTTTDTSPNASNTLPEADQAPFTSTRLLGRKLQNGSILPLPGALGLDSFQAGAVGEESIRGRFSDRVERPQDIYQDVSQGGVRLDATLVSPGQDSQPINSLRSAPVVPTQRIPSQPDGQDEDSLDRDRLRRPAITQGDEPSTDSVDNMLAAGQSSLSKSKTPATSALPESSSPANGDISSPLAARSQRQRRKPTPAPATIATGKTPKARKRRSATPKKSSRSSKSSKSMNAQAPSQAAKNQKAKKKSVKPAQKKSKVAAQSSATEPIAVCCCGSADENDDMVCCDGCDTWLHAVCNGYPTPQSLPEHFFCVACKKEQSLHRSLNKTEKAAVDDQLTPLSQFRGRILMVVRKAKRVPDSDVLLDRLGCARRDVEYLLSRLVRENFVTKESTQGAAGSKKSMVFNDSPDVKRQFLLYFTPGGQIEHDLFDLPDALPMSQLPSSQLPGISSQVSQSAAVRAGPSTIRIDESTFIHDPIDSFSTRASFDSTSAKTKSSRKRKQSPVLAEEEGSEQDAEGEVDDLETIDILKDSGAGSSDDQRGNGPPPSKRMRSSRGVQDVDVTRKTDWDV